MRSGRVLRRAILCLGTDRLRPLTQGLVDQGSAFRLHQAAVGRDKMVERRILSQTVQAAAAARLPIVCAEDDAGEA